MILAATYVAGCSVVEWIYGPGTVEDQDTSLDLLLFMAFDIAMAWVVFA